MEMSTVEKVLKPDCRSKYSDCLAGKGGVWGGICLERGVKRGIDRQHDSYPQIFCAEEELALSCCAVWQDRTRTGWKSKGG